MNAFNEMPRLLRDKRVADILGCSKSFVWELSRRGVLPKPIKVSPKMSVWKLNDILAVAENPQEHFGIK